MENALTSIGSAITHCFGYVGDVMEEIISNPVLVIIFTASVFVPLAIRVFRKIKNAAR